MQKISFNDRYGLTDAVLAGRKTVTRRVEFTQHIQDYFREMQQLYDISPVVEGDHVVLRNTKGYCFYTVPLRYRIGEVVSIAQCYRLIADSCPDVDTFMLRLSQALGQPVEDVSRHAGWTNKMFVRPSLMPRHLQILSARVELLQTITDSDCYREGLEWSHKQHACGYMLSGVFRPLSVGVRDAFAMLIDFVSSRGTWASNPFVVRYEFSLC